jgi:hypothetical protein
MDHPKAIGDRCVLAVMLALQSHGLPCSIPFGENTRYDLVVDTGWQLLRVQCKSGRLRLGAVRFKTASSYAHHPNPKTLKADYIGEIDAFAVYCPETRGVYLVPIDKVALGWQGALRVDPPRNGQRRRIRFAADYEIAKVTLSSSSAPGGSAGAG